MGNKHGQRPPVFLELSCFMPVVLEPHLAFPGGSVGKESTGNAGDTGDMSSIPGLGRSAGGGHGTLPHYSCLEKGAWQATVHRVTKSWTRKRLSTVYLCTLHHFLGWMMHHGTTLRVHLPSPSHYWKALMCTGPFI